jgi:hypothetical protein
MKVNNLRSQRDKLRVALQRAIVELKAYTYHTELVAELEATIAATKNPPGRLTDRGVVERAAKRKGRRGIKSRARK